MRAASAGASTVAVRRDRGASVRLTRETRERKEDGLSGMGAGTDTEGEDAVAAIGSIGWSWACMPTSRCDTAVCPPTQP
ncbi:hypothetical protein GCM10010170_018360 [Dactylosporangium salmoneum]|uniref:Uncharacterized protein n=1 Tax=Dactylosporangium salmoneum TaxID=53361 RepID=A0ABN3FTT2_9ACTN